MIKLRTFAVALAVSLFCLPSLAEKPAVTTASPVANLRENLKTRPDLASSIFRLYPDQEVQKDLTPAPSGYRPFYISHYGRHGSRWLLNDGEYLSFLEPLREAKKNGTLTPKGEKALKVAEEAFADAQGRTSHLAPVGQLQHRGIAERMYNNFPDVFANNAKVDARSTIIVRCVISMSSFLMRLKELNPNLDVTFQSNNRVTWPLEFTFKADGLVKEPEYRYYLDVKGPYFDQIVKTLKEKGVMPQFAQSLLGKDYEFKDDAKHLDFIINLLALAGNLQGVRPDLSLWDIYDDPEQLYWMVMMDNYRWYAKRGPHPDGKKWTQEYAKTFLKDLVARADSAVNGNGNAAELRFGHDVSMMSFIPLMQINETDVVSYDPEEVAKRFWCYTLVPKAANLQLIFYRPVDKKGDVLVKVLYNEKEAKLPIKEAYPSFYRWKDVRDHFEKRIAQKY